MEPGKVPSRATGTCRFMNIDVACGPRPLPGEPDRLYHNTGKGTFVDVTKRAGVIDPGYYGFGVLFSDSDDDGWPDIYVANDSTPNLFFRNQRNGTFVEQALQSGLAVTADGREQSGMGVDAGDYDGDGRLDIVKTNFSQDYTSLYHNDGDGLFTDVSFRSGLAATLGRYLGWGVGFVRSRQRRPARPLHRQRAHLSRRRAHRHEHVPAAQPGVPERRRVAGSGTPPTRSAVRCSSKIEPRHGVRRLRR